MKPLALILLVLVAGCGKEPQRVQSVTNSHNLVDGQHVQYEVTNVTNAPPPPDWTRYLAQRESFVVGARHGAIVALASNFTTVEKLESDAWHLYTNHSATHWPK